MSTDPEIRPETPGLVAIPAPSRESDLREQLLALVLDGVSSQESRRAYARAITEFLAWLPPRPLGKASVQEYRAVLVDHGYSPATVNLRLAAVRKLAVEAADNGLLDPFVGEAVARVKGVRQLGLRLGKWASAEEAIRLLRVPDRRTLRGARDHAVLAVLLGCGLRRNELANLHVSDLQQRDARAVFADLVGKGRRVRTVPVPAWVHAAITSWLNAAGISEGRMFRAIHRSGLVSESLSAAAVLDIVAVHAKGVLLELTPHDLRRTCAKLCRAASGSIEQIQFLLGHASLQTTERYLGGRQEIARAVNDLLELDPL